MNRLGRLWRIHIVVLAVALMAIIAIFAHDVRDIVMIWWSNSTFNHCLLMPPIIGWLIWQRWPELKLIAPRAWLPGLLLVAGGAFCWLLGEVADASIARHLGVVLMLQGAILTLLGVQVGRGLAFPLAYALFLVPAGDLLVPPLQLLTARMSMALLELAGVPAHIEGVFITIPSGLYEVAAACSGVKFLIAMAAYGVLVANVCFRSWTRRILFVVAALVLPVLANGVRAWATIYIAYRINPSFADKFDHVVFGWIFFGVVISLLMAGGWRYFDRPVGSSWLAPLPPAKARTLARRSNWVPGFAGVLAIAFGALALTSTASTSAAKLPEHPGLPLVAGWRAVPQSGVAWKPHFDSADHLLVGEYADSSDRRVALAIAIYGGQGAGREMVGYGQGAVDGPRGRWAWTDNQPSPAGGQAFRMTGPGGVVREAITFYRVGDIMTGSEIRVKIETLKARFLPGPKQAVATIVTSPNPGGRVAIDDFLKQLGPVDALADRLSGREG